MINNRAVCVKVICKAQKYLYKKKIIPILSTDANGTVDRGCQKNLHINSDYCTDFKKEFKDSQCFVCNGDSCNGSTQQFVKFWMFIMALIIVLYMKHQAYYGK